MRMVAIGKVTLNGIAAGEYVRSVELVFPEAVAGKRVIDLSNAEVVSVDAAASQSIRLDYSAQSIEANAMTAYFTCFPIKMKAGDSFTVKLRTTADSYYEKTITLSGEQILEFYNGRISEFSIDMSAAKQVVEFPVVFPMGWQDTDGDGNTDLGWCSLDRPWVVDWINSPAYDKNKVKDSKLSGEAGRLYSYYQPQATLKWVWDEKIANTGIKHYTEVTNGTKNIGSIGIKGVWTDDYFEFVLPVKNFAANTTLNLRMHIYHRLAPVFWEVLYKDGEEWKSTAVDDLLGGIDAKTSAEVRRRATWAIPRIESNATTESTQTVDMPFVNAIEDGNVVIRVKCVDGSLAGNTYNKVSTLTAPYNSSKVASAPLYFSNPANRADSDIVISIVE